MTHSKLTDQIRLSSQCSSRNGATIDTFLVHHQAGTNDDATINAMVSGSKQVSSNYTISNEGRITLVVDESMRAWTSSSALWDGRSITVEIENETAGPDWRISDAALNAAASLLNDLRRRYNIVRVIGHRDLHTSAFGFASYPTYCPGPDTVANILARAASTAAVGDRTLISAVTNGDKEMKFAYIPAGVRGKAFPLCLLFSDFLAVEFEASQETMNAFAGQAGGGAAAPVTQSFFDIVKKQVQANRDALAA